MADIADFLNELDNELSSLKERYISSYIPSNPEHTPDVFEYDVKSYCVLAHACFEEYVEQVSDYILQNVASDFQNRKITLSTVMMLLSYGSNIEDLISGDEETDRCFDIIRKQLDECKSRHSRSIQDNHGFSKKYLRKILVPVGLDVKFDPSQESAITRLSEARGSFAHNRSKGAMYGAYRKAKSILSPEEALQDVVECREACLKISERFRARW